MRAPLPAGGKIELGTGYAGALAPKASPRRQLPRASRGGGGGWGGASRQQQPTSIPRTSHHLATASAAKSKKLDKAPGKREEKYRSWRSVAERGALPPDPRPAGGPGRGLASKQAEPPAPLPRILAKFNFGRTRADTNAREGLLASRRRTSLAAPRAARSSRVRQRTCEQQPEISLAEFGPSQALRY